MQMYPLFILTLAVVVYSTPGDQTPEEWARQQNDQRFNREAYDALPWEEYSKQGFFPRELPRRIRLADSDRQDRSPPTFTSDDLTPTRTDPMGLMRRVPLGTFTCEVGSHCYTFTCKLLKSTVIGISSGQV